MSFVKAYENVSDSKTCVRLYQALPNKYDKIEYILQKGVEVGIREFIFFRPERSQRLLVTAHKIERFQEIVREATEQCGGNLPPSVIFLEDRMIVPENRQSYVLHTEEQGSKHIRDIDIKNSPINIFVGPEGGWSREEISFFEEKNIQKIHLGNRVLRTETTGPIVAFFLIQK
ncbi:TPA: hypothetical protein DCZ36_04040 [Candidatus Gracilibacteria bacterium]|nr:hypothetical protein [Candidatus Gracilibacteria bacterium]